MWRATGAAAAYERSAAPHRLLRNSVLVPDRRLSDRFRNSARSNSIINSPLVNREL